MTDLVVLSPIECSLVAQELGRRYGEDWEIRCDFESMLVSWRQWQVQILYGDMCGLTYTGMVHYIARRFGLEPGRKQKALFNER